MKKLSLITLTALLVALVFGTTAMAKTLINGIDANYPPFAYIDKDGQPAGFDVEAAEWIAAEMGFEVKHQPVEWDSIIPTLRAKKIDFIASGMTASAKRKEQVNFTLPYWQVRSIMIVPEDSDATVEDLLAGKRIAVQMGTNQHNWLVANESKYGYSIQVHNSGPIAVTDMLHGRSDAVAIDDTSAHAIKRKQPVKLLGEFGLHADEFGFAVRKEDKELLETLNEGLRRLMASPRWEELIKKYNPSGE